MKVLVIGGGGREHALIWKIAQSKKVDKIYAAPGNSGISEIAENVDIEATDINGLLNFAKKESIDMTIVGPEVPLVMGISDAFCEAGLKIIGPKKEAAQLEGSKAFSKQFMDRHNLPTARYKEYTNVEQAIGDIGIFGYPMVIKADGLAAGKGVVITSDSKEAEETLRAFMEEAKFGDAGEKIVIEEYLKGIEASMLCFVDGDTILPMESAQDYKKAFDGGNGPNTGGMGTYSPSMIFDNVMMDKVNDRVLQPFLEGLKKDNLDFCGIIFIGLMIDGDKIDILEFNVRFGDPETQSVLPRMKTDIMDVFSAMWDKKLEDITLEWTEEAAICVIMASGGYPESYVKGYPITGLDKAELVFHSGTKSDQGQVLTNGGRVLGVVSMGPTLDAAKESVYDNVKKIDFKDVHYRTDIGEMIIR